MGNVNFFLFSYSGQYRPNSTELGAYIYLIVGESTKMKSLFIRQEKDRKDRKKTGVLIVDPQL